MDRVLGRFWLEIILVHSRELFWDGGDSIAFLPASPGGALQHLANNVAGVHTPIGFEVTLKHITNEPLSCCPVDIIAGVYFLVGQYNGHGIYRKRGSFGGLSYMRAGIFLLFGTVQDWEFVD